METRTYTYDLQDIDTVVSKMIGEGLTRHKIITLSGNLGAGKTTLVKAICHALQITDEVSSPSFSLVNEYQGENVTIYHIDLYRIESMEEALEIGIEDYLYGDGICLIEWPGIIEALIPSPVLEIRIENLGNFTRKLHLREQYGYTKNP